MRHGALSPPVQTHCGTFALRQPKIPTAARACSCCSQTNPSLHQPDPQATAPAGMHPFPRRQTWPRGQ